MTNYEADGYIVTLEDAGQNSLSPILLASTFLNANTEAQRQAQRQAQNMP